jgi:hypothetical protein
MNSDTDDFTVILIICVLLGAPMIGALTEFGLWILFFWWAI